MKKGFKKNEKTHLIRVLACYNVNTLIFYDIMALFHRKCAIICVVLYG